MPVRLVSNEELPGSLKGYRLIERLGRGGFGEVWKAEAPGGLLKAIKFVFGDGDSIDEDEARPALQEEKALHRVKTIRHPFILSLERFDKIDGQLIIVMELADCNLWDCFRKYRAQGLVGIPRDELLRFMEEAAEALDLMNVQYQIQHLDVKPQNLFLVHNHVKVADFGLAKVFEGKRGTITGGVTPVYAGPETFEGYVSRYTDQYSLAIVYQELLTGRRPFDGANTKQLLMQHLNGVPDLSSICAAEQPILARALSKDPDHRWPSNMELVLALRHAGTAPAAGSKVLGYGQRAKTDTPLPPAPTVGPIATAARPAPTAAKVAGGSGVVSPALRSALVGPGPSGFGGHPRLVTPQGAASGMPAPALTLQLNQIVQTGRMSSLGIAPPEKTGDGVLMPALVVGVGATGLAVLRLLRRAIREQFGHAGAIPTIRFLYLDTDPEAVALATAGPDPLSAREIVLTRLGRPSHYLQEGATPGVEQWMAPGLLYQLPKNAGPAGGVRGFGRLAFCDHFRTIAQRVRQEVETFLRDEPLDKLGAATGLGVRTNRARAYVVAGTAGGTGSGMFLDLAYVIKHELRSIGYRKPETVGVLLAPPADSTSARNVGLANTYAALAELHHFSGGARYQTKLDANEPALIDTEGPFARCAVLQLPAAPKPRLQQEVYGLAARGLFTELLTAVGRATDAARAATPVTGDPAAPRVQSFGLQRLTWPRPELLTAAMRHFNRQLLQRWAGKEATHLKEPLGHWLDDLWAKQRFDVPAVVGRFHAAAREALREDPDLVFAAAVDTLRTRTPGAGRVDASAACAVLDQLIRLVGRPPGEQSAAGSLDATIDAVARKIVVESEADLSALAVSFIEQPQYRLAGAEEALNQLTQRLRATIEGLEDHLAGLTREVNACYSRLMQLIGTLSGTSGLNTLPGRKTSITHELYEALQSYPTRRLLFIEYNAAVALYRGLMGNIPEYIREVNFCRGRLGDMRDAFAEPPRAAERFVCGKLILPAGCATVEGTVERVIDALPAEDILAFDQGLQKDLAKQFSGLANLCLKVDRTAEFVALLAGATRGFLDARLEKTDPATMLLRYQGSEDDTEQMLLDAYEKAAPGLTALSGPRPREAATLALPPGRSGERLRRLFATATQGATFTAAALGDDIVIVREFPHLALAALPQLAAHARDAYERQLASDGNPHTRSDIRWPAPGL